MLRIVSVSDMYVSKDPEDVIVTYSLGSCIGVSAYDRSAKVGGMMHCMLPRSAIDPGKARQTPCMFMDSGLLRLLQTLFNMGAGRETMSVKAAGAASILDPSGLFRIGERNYGSLRSVLMKNGIKLAAEDIGGSVSRTMSLHMRHGITKVKSGGREVEL